MSETDRKRIKNLNITEMDTNTELIKQVTERAQEWLSDAYDAETRAEVRHMLEAEDKTELIESFYRDLEFGTGAFRSSSPLNQLIHATV